MLVGNTFIFEILAKFCLKMQGILDFFLTKMSIFDQNTIKLLTKKVVFFTKYAFLAEVFLPQIDIYPFKLKINEFRTLHECTFTSVDICCNF